MTNTCYLNKLLNCLHDSNALKTTQEIFALNYNMKIVCTIY